MSSEEARASFSELVVGSPTRTEGETYSSGDMSSEEGAHVTCFTEDLHDVTLHFQIVRFSKQVGMFSWLQLKYQTEKKVLQIHNIAQIHQYYIKTYVTSDDVRLKRRSLLCSTSWRCTFIQ
jgi:hypothetical protein